MLLYFESHYSLGVKLISENSIEKKIFFATDSFNIFLLISIV